MPCREPRRDVPDPSRSLSLEHRGLFERVANRGVIDAADAKLENFDPDGIFKIRDLGVKGATDGNLEARILSAAQPCPRNLGRHRHDVELQVFYVAQGVD